MGGPFCNHEVDLASINVAKIAKIQFPAGGVLFEVHPFEEMTCDQILEARSFPRNERPIQVIMLLLLFYSTDAWRSKRGEAKD